MEPILSFADSMFVRDRQHQAPEIDKRRKARRRTARIDERYRDRNIVAFPPAPSTYRHAHYVRHQAHASRTHYRGRANRRLRERVHRSPVLVTALVLHKRWHRRDASTFPSQNWALRTPPRSGSSEHSWQLPRRDDACWQECCELLNGPPSRIVDCSDSHSVAKLLVSDRVCLIAKVKRVRKAL